MFAEVVRDPGAQLAELLLAVDHELGVLPPLDAIQHLETLAASVAERTSAAASVEAQASTLADVLGRRACLRACAGDRPESLLLGPALAHGRLHPHLLCTVYAQVAQWAGLPWAIAAGPGALGLVPAAVGDDPAHRLEPPPRVIVPREVAFIILGALARAFDRRLHLGPALRAAELRRHVAIKPCCRHRAQAEWLALSARLN
jgi:hypothetical protein